MNVKRGLLRLWVVLSIGWACFMVADHYPRIKSPYVPQIEYQYRSDTDTFEPYTRDPDPDKWLEFYKTTETVSFPRNVTVHFPNNISSDTARTLSQRVRKELVAARETEVSEKRLQTIFSLVESAIVPPAVLFLIGGALLWAFAGFRRSKPS